MLEVLIGLKNAFKTYNVYVLCVEVVVDYFLSFEISLALHVLQKPVDAINYGHQQDEAHNHRNSNPVLGFNRQLYALVVLEESSRASQALRL